jgi:hypothetical protein
MNSAACNLEASKYGYDLVCATTQASINATMKQFLAGFQATEFTACYTFDPKTEKKVLTPLSDIVKAIGGDPFSIPNNAPSSDPMLQKLYTNCKFEFGFRAKMGLPLGIAPTKMPDIIVLNKGNSLVSYQLYCAEFEVILLANNFGDIQFTNLSQPKGSPWLFLFEVNLDMRTGDKNAFNSLPQGVQNKIKNLNPDSMFSVKQLYLDLNSAGLQGMPTIQGLDPTSDAYVYLTRTFINQYWANLGTSGVLLGYAVLPNAINPNPQAPSIIPTDLNIEVSPYLDAQGKQTANYPLYTLNYLVMSGGARMPAPVQFQWNWVEQTELTDFQGTMAVRRNIFADFLHKLVAPASRNLSIDTNISMTHSGEDFTTRVSAPSSPNPAQWTLVPAGGKAGPDGFAPLLTIGYNHHSYDSSEDALHLSSINGTFNYAMSGSIEVGGKGGNIIRLKLHTVAYLEFNAHIVGIQAANLEANIVDYQSTALYTINIDGSGKLVATMSPPQNIDNKQDINESKWDDLIGLGGVASMIERVRTQLSDAVRNSTQGYENIITRMLNGSAGWVFPGGKTFFFKEASFSDYQDLVTHVTYVDPT